VNGVVDKKNQFGIFLNVGCESCHGKLQIPRFLGNQLLRGQVLRDLCVATVDLEARRVRLIVDEIDSAIADPEIVSLAAMMAEEKDPKAPEPKQNSTPKPAPKAKELPGSPQAKAQPKADDEQKEDKEWKLEVGDLMDGVVVNINAKGVWVNIGGPKRALLDGYPLTSKMNSGGATACKA